MGNIPVEIEDVSEAAGARLREISQGLEKPTLDFRHVSASWSTTLKAVSRAHWKFQEMHPRGDIGTVLDLLGKNGRTNADR